MVPLTPFAYLHNPTCVRRSQKGFQVLLTEKQACIFLFLRPRGSFCRSVVDTWETSRGTGAFGHGGSSHGGGTLSSTLEMLQGDTSYALQAAKRSEKRRLLNFIKLLDFMVADGLHTVLMTDTKSILQALLQLPAEVFGEVSDRFEVQILGIKRATSLHTCFLKWLSIF